MTPLYGIPTNLIMGFLGVGKTSAILHLLKHKPENEQWAVLVNEYGAIGVDGSILSNHGATIKQVPGGCICCAVGLPFQVAINQLLAQARPDRLIIEPSGLAHPQRVLKQLSEYPFQQVLSLKASICLLDPRKLNDERYLHHETFIDQIALADVLVANKIDLADRTSIKKFYTWASDFVPTKSVVEQAVNGKLALEWLDISRDLSRKAHYVHYSKAKPALSDTQSQQQTGYHTWGKIFGSDVIFSFKKLNKYLNQYRPQRLKAIFHTDKGWIVVNRSENQLSVIHLDTALDSRIEIISSDPSWQNVQTAIDCCQMNRET